jgi:hypothetical protein
MSQMDAESDESIASITERLKWRDKAFFMKTDTHQKGTRKIKGSRIR